MKFAKLAQYFEQLEQVSGRLEMTRILAELLNKAEAQEIDKAVYLSLGQLGPSYEQIEFNLAEKMVLRATTLAYETEADATLRSYKKLGDVGLVTYELSQKTKHQKNSQLTISEVYEGLLQIAKDNGIGSQERKVNALAKLLSEADPISAKYIARMPVGKLRLGFGEMTILDAISWAVTGDKSLHAALEDAYNVAADVGYLAKHLKQQHQSDHDLNKDKVILTLKKIQVKLGIPVVPALCQRLKSFGEIITKMDEVAVEPKYDGTRLQIHWRRSDNLLKTFTRNLEENSPMFPELQQLGKYVKGDSFIFDCEAIGVDPQTGKILPFQVTMTRKRKHEVAEQIIKVPLRFTIFDLLYTDQGDIHHLPLLERRKILEHIIKPNSQVEIIRQTVTQEAEVCRRLHQEYLNEGLEGVVVKKCTSSYTPGRKGWNWVKMKEVETARAGLSDTLDCVVMGYYKGRGKRAGFGLGAFLVGIKNKNIFLTVTKIGTGLSDEQFRELNKRLEILQVAHKPEACVVNKLLEPDVWVKPEIVVEIAADNITKSPTHTAGLALRFPRLVHFRDDKGPDQTTTLKELETLFKLQK